MHRGTIESRLARLKILADAVNVPDDFTMSYADDNFAFKFETLKENLENYMEVAVTNLLGPMRNLSFKYYNEWYKVLSKIYSKQYSGSKQFETKN